MDTSDFEERDKCGNCDVRDGTEDYIRLPGNSANSDLGRTVGTPSLVHDLHRTGTSGSHDSEPDRRSMNRTHLVGFELAW